MPLTKQQIAILLAEKKKHGQIQPKADSSPLNIEQNPILSENPAKEFKSEMDLKAPKSPKFPKLKKSLSFNQIKPTKY